MNLQALSALCSPLHVLADKVTLFMPQDFGNIEGCAIHDCRLLILVCRGQLSLTVNGREYGMRANSLLDLLDWARVEVTHSSPDLKAYCLLPTFEFTGEAMCGLKPGPESYFQDRLYLPVIDISGEDCLVLERQLMALGQAMADVEHCYRKELVRTYFKLFLLELGHIMLTRQRDSCRDNTAVGRKDIIVTEFLKLVWNYFRTERSIGFYAEKLNISPKHLARTVKEILGKTPYEVISEELVQYASTLLRDERLSILEVSALLRFSEQAAFSKFFKKHVGVAPSEYRRKVEVGAEDWET